MKGYLCPYCEHPTTYRVFSGGKEWYCPQCKADGDYPEDQTPPRLKLLQSGAGRVALRAQMDQELARRRDERS